MELDLPLARGALDAMTTMREKSTISQILNDGPAAFHGLVDGEVSNIRLFFLDSTGSVGLIPSGDGLHVFSVPASCASLFSFPIDEGDAALIGRTGNGVAYIAIALPTGQEDALEETLGESGQSEGIGDLSWHSVRRVGHLLSDDDSAMTTAASALLFWRAATSFCTRCGAAVRPTGCGWTVTCSQCDHIEYPRQDPAVIVAIVDDDERLLLAHNSGWKAGYYSLIAGFMEAGEAPERAVAREVREEVGLDVRQVRYQGAQPWPFPRSLMLGFTAHVTGGHDSEPDVRPDGSEITNAAFYSRDEFAQCLRDGRIIASGPTAIAHGLIEQWFGGPYLHLQQGTRSADARAH